MSGTQPLCAQFDVLLLDLDGVVYAGSAAIPHAVESLTAAHAAGVRLAFVTNNASRTPESIAEHLTGLGLNVDPAEVVTSAQAGARVLRERHQAGSPVLVVGGEGLIQAVRQRGFLPVSAVSEQQQPPAAVIQGFSPDVGWQQLAEATYAVRAGADFIATNTDRTIPTARGIGPGNGLLVGVVEAATGVAPVVAGKPHTPLMDESAERTGAKRPLVVGDRLDTDIEGANNAGLPSLLVLTGVSSLADVARAPVSQRPTYLGRDLRALLSAEVVALSGPAATSIANLPDQDAADDRPSVDGGASPSSLTSDDAALAAAGVAVRAAWEAADHGRSPTGAEAALAAAAQRLGLPT